MAIARRVLLSRWLLTLGLIPLAFVWLDAQPSPSPLAPHRHGVIGIPRNAHTRIVGPPATQSRRSQASGRSVTAPAHATFQILDTANPLSPQARAAFEYAVGIWAGLINSAVPIRVYAGWGGNPGVLATGSTSVNHDFSKAPVPGVWYTKPLANALAGADVQPGAAGEMQVIFDPAAPWYFGTDGRPPAGTYDFVTVALHEIGHPLGFLPLMWGDGGWGVWGITDMPGIYSRFVANGAGQSLLNTTLFPNPGSALGSQLASNNLFWSGAAGIAALGGTRPRLYAPSSWASPPKSSLDHLDEVTYPPANPNSLMTPMINMAEAIHVPGPAMLGMLADMGWPQDSSCSYTLDATDLLVPPEGITGVVVNVSTPATCQWTSVSNSGFVTVTSGASRNGPSPTTLSVAANPGVYRTGSLTIAGMTVTVRQNGAAPAMTVDKSTLRFGAASTGATFTALTPAQVVRLRQSGTGTVTWTAQATQPWLQVSPASGTGSADLTISVVAAAGVPVSGTVTGAIQVTLTGAGTLAGPIAVTLTTTAQGQTTAPFGFVDTPADMTTGVTGAIGMTGWALDDIGIERVTICRLPLAGESVGPNPHCGGRSDIFVGFAVRVDGARPDVQAGYATYPQNTSAGWGFMILTNMLPLEGNGAYTFLAWAIDREGNATRLGTRTVICDNQSATKPFGAIDTPEQGGIASGNSYVNFGWALTQTPKTIPFDGSTITVLVDGFPIGNATYNNYRPDIATLFPNRNNSNGAVGYRLIDTTLLQNGLHTISWVVTDDQGVTEGLGSRFFTVSNGASAVSARVATGIEADAHAAAAAPTDSRSVIGRRGFDLAAPWTAYAVGADGRAIVRGEELDRIELALGRRAGERVAGFLRIADTLAPLPAGSQLDASTGAFAWAPGVGFVGTYDLVFLHSRADRIVSRQEVRIVLGPKGSGRVGPQVTIDVPRPQQDVAQPFAISGWAADLDAAAGTGVSTVHVWAYPLAGGPPIFLGAAPYGDARPDVAAVHGERFRDAGFSLTVQGLTHGNYDLAVFAWSTTNGRFAAPTFVRLTVR